MQQASRKQEEKRIKEVAELANQNLKPKQFKVISYVAFDPSALKWKFSINWFIGEP